MFEMIPFKLKRFVEVIVVRASNIYGSYGRTKTRLKIVEKIIYGKLKKLLVESRTMSLSLRRFVALPKIMQADYQPRSPQDKIVQITV